MPHPTDRVTHITALVTLVVEHWLERKLAQDRSEDPSHDARTLLLWSYIPLRDWKIAGRYFTFSDPRLNTIMYYSVI